VLTPGLLAFSVQEAVALKPLTFHVTVPVGDVAVPAPVSVTVAVDVIGVPWGTLKLLGVMLVLVLRRLTVIDPDPELKECWASPE